MKEETSQIRIAGEFIKVENTEDEPEEKIFEALFEESDDNDEANLELKNTSQELAFALEIKTT